eukprot:jgi/Psemu1/48275/gm1.48275_g
MLTFMSSYKQGLAVVDKCVLRLGTSIKGDQRLEITLPKAEKILMFLVIGHASKSNVDIASHSSTETGLNCYSICYSSGGYSEELYLPQPDESTLMRIYFQCDLAGLSFATGLPKTSWDSYKTFVDDYRSLDLSAPGDMSAAWLSDYTISLWCFMMSMSASRTVHIFYRMFYKYISSDKEEYRKSINFDFTTSPKRRLFIIPINLGGSHWAVNLVFHGSNGQYSAIQFDPMVPKSKFPSEKESLLLADFFSTDTNKNNPCGVFVCFYVCWISQHGRELIYKLDKEHDETSADLSATAINNEFCSFVSGMCPVEFRKEYANFIKVLRQKYNQLGIEGVEGKITDVLTHDYGGDKSELIDVWSNNIEKRTADDTELMSENKVSTSYKTKLSPTNSAQKSKSGIRKFIHLTKMKVDRVWNIPRNRADGFKEARELSYRNRADGFKEARELPYRNRADGFKDARGLSYRNRADGVKDAKGLPYRNRTDVFKDDYARLDVNRVTISQNL